MFHVEHRKTKENKMSKKTVIHIATGGRIEANGSMFYTETLMVLVGKFESLNPAFGHATSPEESYNQFLAAAGRILGKKLAEVEFVQSANLPTGWVPRNAQKPAATPGEVMSGKEVAEAEKSKKQSAEVARRGEAVIRATMETGERYLDLCRYIRENQIDPKLVTASLTPLGFARSRISEIKKIAYATDELWNEYAARNIGWKGALDLARAEGVKQIADAAHTTVEEAEEGLEDADLTPGETGETKEATVEDKAASKLVTIAAHGKAILTAAEFFAKEDNKAAGGAMKPCQVWDMGNGYKLVLTYRAPKAKKKAKK